MSYDTVWCYRTCWCFQAARCNCVKWFQLGSTCKHHLCKSCSTALLPETVETNRVACGWLTIFLFDGNKTCLRVWMCRVAVWPDCCTVTKTGVFAEEGPENHLPNCVWYAVWVRVCICWCTAPLCSEIWIGEEVLSLHHTTFSPNGVIQKFFPGFGDTVYPIPLTKTNKYRSFIHYALAKYQ